MHDTVPRLLDARFARSADQVAIIERQSYRRHVWTYRRLEAETGRMVALLQQRSLAKGDHVAVCAPNGPWWIVAYLACARLGIVLVPIDVNSSETFVTTVLAQTKTRLLIRSASKLAKSAVSALVIEDLGRALSELTGAEPRCPPIGPDDVLEVVFTSGSTGDPKGVVLTHGNVMSNVHSFLQVWPTRDRQVALSMVPLSHMLEQTAGFWAPFSMGVPIVYVPSPRPSELVKALHEERITMILTVPAFLQLLRRRVVGEAERRGKGEQTQKLVRLGQRLPRALARLVTRPIRRQLGNDLQLVAVGGAPLPEQVEDFWNGLGVTVVQGYGLTEASPLAAYSTPTDHRARSVGRSLPGQELKLAENGEILLRGPHVSRGVIDSDGWLHSGDIGELDRDGFLFIRGRVKNILLTASGMNVYPEDIEAELLNHRAIRDAVALISTHKGTEQLTAVLLTDLDEGAARAVVKEVNQSLASHQAIARVVIWPDVDFPRTPTRKVKRREVQTAIDREAAAACTAPAHDADMLHAIIREVSPTAGIIEPHSLLASDLGIDSIKRLELITFIEERLLVVVDEASLSNDTTVGDLVRLIDAARGAGSASAPKRAYGWLYALPVAAARSLLQALLLAPLRLSQRLSATSPLPLEPPAVFIANHTSHLDSLTFLRLAGYRGRRRLIVAAAGDYFFATRVTGFLSRFLVNAVPIDRTGNVRQSLDMIGHHLDAGRSVAIFPEGTRSPTGRMQSFKPGIGLIAQALEVPIIPVRLEGNFEQWPKGARWPRRGSTVVKMGGARRYSVTTSADTIAKDLQRAVERL